MIDMDPSDNNCIYSTLKFVCRMARKYEMTAILTMDQPLYWKSLLLCENEPNGSELGDMVNRIAGFHIEMSFLGTIGTLLEATGIKEVLELLYAKNAATHMLTGKAVLRAIRGHLLVVSALNVLIMKEALTEDGDDVKEVKCQFE